MHHTVAALKASEVQCKSTKGKISLTNERLQHLLTSTSVIIYTAKTSGDYGATFISDNITSMVRYEPEDFLRKSSFWVDHIHPEDVQRVLDELPRIFEKEVYTYEYRFKSKDGTNIWVRDEMKMIRDEEGKPIEITGFWIDITERKKFEKELIMSEEKYRSLIENAKDAIISTNAEGKIVSFNKTAEDMFGYTCEKILGKSITLLSPPSERERQKKLLEHLKATKELYIIGKTMEGKGIKKDGQEFSYEGSPFLLELEEEIILTVILRDITERKEMQYKLLQSEKLKSLGELAGGVAHDFNNVLAAILGRAQLLKMNIEPPVGVEEKRKSVLELKEGLEVIESAARDGAETVKRIQEFSRRRADDKDFSQVDINEMIKNPLEFTKTRWKNDAEIKGIQISIQKELSPLPSTTGSAAELREVFTNLINNAVDAMPQGGEIKIKTSKEDGHISIKVEDKGIGIPKAIRDRIFDPFFTTKGVQSTGLGLSVSYGIINRHRGAIKVDSSEGKGTKFTIKLPISEKRLQKEEKADAIIEKQRKAHILVIEDEKEVRDTLAAILKKSGHEVEAASDGNQGVELFGKKEFDLVFTDLGMPGMSGWQVAEKIKSLNGRVPVAIITGWNIELDESEIKDKWGVDLIIYKPFEVNQVLRLVQEGMVLRDRFKAA